MSSSTQKIIPGCVIALFPLLLGFFIMTLPILLVMIAVAGGKSYESQQTSSTSCGTSALEVSSEVRSWMALAATNSGLPEAWLTSVAKQESSFDPKNFTNDENGGTWGLFQINREEWASVYPGESKTGIGTPTKITDPETHAIYGGKYFKNRMETVKKLKAKYPDKEFAKLSDLDALAIAHNAGEGNLVKFPKIPKSTNYYLSRVREFFTPVSCNPSGPPPSPGSNDLFGKDDYGPYWKSKGKSNGEDDWAFYWGECVSYAAFMVRTHTPHSDFHNFWRGGDPNSPTKRFGHAKQWDERAKVVGVRVDTTPAVGAIAQHSRYKYGHVAYIAAVHEDGTFDINEYNHGVERHTFGTRQHVSIPKDFDVVIHFEE